MGLSISVGQLAWFSSSDGDSEGAEWLRGAMADVNAVLAENDLSAHEEPEDLPNLNSKWVHSGFPYSYLHYLRRLYAHVKCEPGTTPSPVSVGDNPADDPLVEEISFDFGSHLVCHSDSSGFYVPIDFSEPVFDNSGRIPGGFLGSSYGLRSELIEIAPALGIKLEGDSLSADEMARVESVANGNGDFAIEHLVWIALFEAARLSIEHKTIIVFH